MSKDQIVTELTVETTEQSLAPGEVLIGSLVSLNDEGKPLVSCPSIPQLLEPLIAMTTVNVSAYHIGRQVAIMFVDGEFKQPIITGFIHSPLTDMLESYHLPEEPLELDKDIQVEQESTAAMPEADIDGKRVVIEGKEEVVLKCGASSITLTQSGKILIRGKYLLSRSEGINRILGGSVQVN